MPNKVFTPDLAVIRNQGVRVKVHKVQQRKYTEGTGADAVEKVEYRTAGEESFTIRLTNAALADLEEEYGTLDLWIRYLWDQPVKTLLFTFGLLTGEPRAYVSEMIIMGSNEEYQLACLTAYTTAMGAPVDSLGKLLAQGTNLGTEKDEVFRVLYQELIPNMASSPSEPSVPAGSNSENPSPTSGDTVPDRSDSSSGPSTTPPSSEPTPAADEEGHPANSIPIRTLKDGKPVTVYVPNPEG